VAFPSREFLIANSEGPNWGWHNSTGSGSRGFFWIAYTMFLERQFGYYDDPWSGKDPCYGNAAQDAGNVDKLQGGPS